MNVRNGLRNLSLALALVALPAVAKADKLGWVDDVVRGIVKQTRQEVGATARPLERGLLRAAEGSLEDLARGADDLARGAGRSADQAARVVDEARFARLVERNADSMRTFRALSAPEKRLVTQVGEAAQMVTRRYPDQADTMIRRLGVEGLSAVRAYGVDVAPVIAREGPDAVNVLRKTGRSGWVFYTDVVLRNKKKLAAAGVLALFLADPDKFVDTAGRATQYAVEQFARAGVALAGAVGQGALAGAEGAVAQWLEARGLNNRFFRAIGIGLAGVTAVGAVLVLVGMPIRMVMRPITWPLRAIGRVVGRPARGY